MTISNLNHQSLTTINNEVTGSTIKIDQDEPEVPLTGYNYRKYFNEGSLLQNAALSANKVR